MAFDVNSWIDESDEEKKKKQTPSQQASADIKATTKKFDPNSWIDTPQKKTTPIPTAPKVTPKPQDKGFDLGGFLGNLGDTIKKAISTAIPQANQVQPEKDIAGVDLTGVQPQQSVTPTGTPSAQLQPVTNPIFNSGQQKVKNIIDSVIKYNPKTVQPVVNQLDNLRNILIKEFPQTATRIDELVSKKSDLDNTGEIRKKDKGNVAGAEAGKHVLTDMYNAVMPTLVDGVRRAYEDKLPSKNIAEAVGKKIAVVTGATNIAFTPISAFFAAIENFPVIGKIAGAVSLPFAAVGEGATKFSDTLIDNLFVSNPEVKNAIKRPVGEAFALASQIALGKAMHITEQKAVSTIKNVGIETFTKLTKNISEQSGQPTVYNISPAEVRKIATIGSKSVEANILRDLGLSGDEWSNAAKKGISVQVSPEKVVGIVDKPYFAKIKSLLKIEPVDTIKTIPGNASVRGNFAGSLPEHILTPEQAIAQADGTNLSGTPAGISMKEAAIKAQSEGKNIKVELTNTKDGLTTPEGTRVKYTIVNEQAPIQKMTGEKPGEVKTQPTTLEELIKIKQPTLEQVKLINKLRGEQMAQTGGKSAENIAEVKMGWKPDQKDAFDKALSTGDKATVEKMLPDVPQDFKDKFSKEIEQVMSGVKSETPTKAIDPLLSEAKKYKSAEEFVNSQVNSYHGTNKSFDKFELTEGKRTGGMGAERTVKNNAIFLSNDRNVADFFGKNRSEVQGGYNRIIETKIPQEQILDLSKLPSDVKRKAIDLVERWTGDKHTSIPADLRTWLVDQSEFVDLVKSKGFKGVRFNEGSVLKGDRYTLKTQGGNYTTAIFDPKDILTKSQLTDIWNQANTAPVSKTDPLDLTEETKILRGTKGMTADDIMKTYPNIQLKKDIPATDVYGNKTIIPEGEKLTPYELKGNKILLQDGETYIVTKNQFQNIKGQSKMAEGKPFAPELEGLDETVKGDVKKRDYTLAETNAINDKFAIKLFNKPYSKLGFEERQNVASARRDDFYGQATKYSQYTLPGGENYREILIKTKPNEELANKPMSRERFNELNDMDSPYTGYEEYLEAFGKNEVVGADAMFKSSHWDDLNVIAHLRMNDREYNGEKVAFMEELQSDWAREGRSKGFDKDTTGWTAERLSENQYWWEVKDAKGKVVVPQMSAPDATTAIQGAGRGIPNNPLLKNWQELSIKRALKDAVNSDAEYFAWINGEQTSNRYNLATHVENVVWYFASGYKTIKLQPKETADRIEFGVDAEGVIRTVENERYVDWKGKKLDEVLGKGLADKIMADEKGTLSGEGLRFGGEWANTLYDKQVKNIVEDLTGGKVETIDMGLPVDKEVKRFLYNGNQGADIMAGDRVTADTIKVGQEIYEAGKSTNHIITEVLGEGKFKAISTSELFDMSGDERTQYISDLRNPGQYEKRLLQKNTEDSRDWINKQLENRKRFLDENSETFDISQKTTQQQALKLTPEIKARIKGEALQIETSGKMFEDKIKAVKNKKQDVKVARPTQTEVRKEEAILKVKPVGTKVSEARLFNTLKARRGSQLAYGKYLMVKDGKAIMSDDELEVRVYTNTDQKDGLYTAEGNTLIRQKDLDEEMILTPVETQKSLGSIKAQELQTILSETAPFVSDDDVRPVMTGTLIEVKDGVTKYTSTDGFRMYHNETVTGLKDGKYIISNVDRLNKLSGVLGDGNIDMTTNDTIINLKAKDSTIEVRLIQGDFPPYERVYPAYKQRFELPKDEMLSAIKELKPYIKKQTSIVGVSIKKGKIELKVAYTNEAGEILNKVKSIPILSEPEIDTTAGDILNGAVIMPVMRTGDVLVEDNGFVVNMDYLADTLKTLDGNSAFVSLEKYGKTEKPVHIADKQEAPIVKEKKKKAPSGMASSGAESIGEFESRATEPEREEHELKIFEQVQALINKYAQSVGEGYTPRGALGVYYGDTKNIRINGMNDLSVASHEITHFLDFAYKISERLRGITGYTTDGKPMYDKATRAFRKEITDLYVKYYPTGSKKHSLRKRVVEGFATLLQKYAEMPRQITLEYPDLVKHFLTPGGDFYEPIIGEILSDLNKFIADYQALDPLDKIGARVANSALKMDKKDLLNPLEKIRTFVEDEIYPVEKVGKMAGVSWSKNDPSLWLRAYKNAGGIYANNILNDKNGYWGLGSGGEFEKKYDYNWNTLLEHLKKEKTQNSFGNYLVARDQYFEWQELDKLQNDYDLLKEQVTLLTPEQRMEVNKDGKTTVDLMREARSLLESQKKYLNNNGFTRSEVEESYNGNRNRFVKESEIYDNLVREDLKLLNHADVGLVSDSVYTDLTSKEGYASMKRQMYDEVLGEEQDKFVGAKSTKASSLKKRTGGQQQIINPVLNGMVNHVEIVKKAMRQIIYNKLGNIAVSGKLPLLFQKQQLRVFTDDQGRFIYPQERDPNIIMSRIDGKRVPFLVDKTIKKTVDDVLTYQAMNVFEHIMVNVTRGFTMGTTGAFAPFALSNTVVDQWSAVLNTRNEYTPLLDQAKIIGKLLYERGGEVGSYYKEWQILGGDRMTLFQSQMQTMEDAVKYVTQETNKLEKIALLLDKGIDFLSLPAKYSETMSRFTEYYNARKSGKNQLVALEEAGRVTAPFHHIGSWKVGDAPSAKYWIRSVPFANAGFQVLAQTIRTAETAPGRRRLFFVMAALAAAYLSSIAMVSQFGSDDQKEQYKDLNPTDLGTYLHYPAMNGKGLIRVKISQDLSTLGTLMAMVIADKTMGTKYSRNDYKDALTNWIPRQINILSPVEMFFSWFNPAIKIPLELIANFKDYPRVRPLESQGMRNREPKDRYNEATSPLAKYLGKSFNVSPIQTDFLIEGFFGRASRYVTGKSGAYDPFSQGYRDYLFTLGRRVQDFYDDKVTVDQHWKTIKDMYQGKPGLSQSVRADLINTNAKRLAYSNIENMLSEFRKVDIKKEPAKAKVYRDGIILQLEKLDKLK